MSNYEKRLLSLNQDIKQEYDIETTTPLHCRIFKIVLPLAKELYEKTTPRCQLKQNEHKYKYLTRGYKNFHRVAYVHTPQHLHNDAYIEALTIMLLHNIFDADIDSLYQLQDSNQLRSNYLRRKTYTNITDYLSLFELAYMILYHPVIINILHINLTRHQLSQLIEKIIYVYKDSDINFANIYSNTNDVCELLSRYIQEIKEPMCDATRYLLNVEFTLHDVRTHKFREQVSDVFKSLAIRNNRYVVIYNPHCLTNSNVVVKYNNKVSHVYQVMTKEAYKKAWLYKTHDANLTEPLFKVYDYDNDKFSEFDSEDELLSYLHHIQTEFESKRTRVNANVDRHIVDKTRTKLPHINDASDIIDKHVNNKKSKKKHAHKVRFISTIDDTKQLNILYLVSYGVEAKESIYNITYIVDPTEETPEVPKIEFIRGNHQIVMSKDDFVKLILSTYDSVNKLSCSYAVIRDEIVKSIYHRNGSVNDEATRNIKYQQRKKDAVNRYRTEYTNMARVINEIIHESNGVADFQQKFITKMTSDIGIGIDENDLAVFSMVLSSYLQYQDRIIPEDIFAIVKAYFAKFNAQKGSTLDDDEADELQVI